MITPVLRKLKRDGYHVIMNTSERGMLLLKENPNIDEFIEYKTDEVPMDELEEHWENQRKKINPDYYCNFSRSIEHNVALHPTDSLYIYTKEERNEVCNRNYYDATFEWAKLDISDKLPDLYLTAQEEYEVSSYVDREKFTILWAMSGSGSNKVYPWTEFVCGEILNNHKDIQIITVGDEKCQIIEPRAKEIMNLAGKTNMRISCALTGVVDLVISPDTGVLHASGCYDTPKIGLLGHTTKENITKHFLNDYSIEAKVACAPCHRLIYDYQVQCPVDELTQSAWCMGQGIKPERVYEQVDKVIREKREYNSSSKELSDMQDTDKLCVSDGGPKNEGKVYLL